jgi:hypothetical protein
LTKTVEELIADIEARQVAGNVLHFGSNRAGAKLSNKRGDTLIIMLDNAGYYSVTANDVTLIAGKA